MSEFPEGRAIIPDNLHQQQQIAALERIPSYRKAITALLITELAGDIARWARGKGFWDIPTGVAAVMAVDDDARKWVDRQMKSTKQVLIVTEVAELVEGLRKKGAAVKTDGTDAEGFTNEESECADQIIRILDYCGQYNLRIGPAIVAKMAVNEGRPYQHGKAF